MCFTYTAILGNTRMRSNRKERKREEYKKNLKKLTLTVWFDLKIDFMLNLECVFHYFFLQLKKSDTIVRYKVLQYLTGTLVHCLVW